MSKTKVIGQMTDKTEQKCKTGRTHNIEEVEK